MRIAKGTVIDGHIVLEGEELKDGTDVTVLVADERRFSATVEEEKLLLEAIAEGDRNELLTAEDVLGRLR